MGKGVATEVPGMSQTAIWALDVQNCILLLRATPAQQQQNVVKIEFKLICLSVNLMRWINLPCQMLSGSILGLSSTILEPTLA